MVLTGGTEPVPHGFAAQALRRLPSAEVGNRRRRVTPTNMSVLLKFLAYGVVGMILAFMNVVLYAFCVASSILPIPSRKIFRSFG